MTDKKPESAQDILDRIEALEAGAPTDLAAIRAGDLAAYFNDQMPLGMEEIEGLDQDELLAGFRLYMKDSLEEGNAQADTFNMLPFKPLNKKLD